MMSVLIIYFCWYLTLLGTGVYFLSNAIGGRDHLPNTIAWSFLWKAQLVSGLLMTSFPFVHLWIASRV